MKVCLILILLIGIVASQAPKAHLLNSTVFYEMLPLLVKHASGLGVTLQMRYIGEQSEARDVAISAYDSIAKPKFSSFTIKRPVSEHTDYNRNIAILYASRMISIDLVPSAKADWDNLLISFGLNPNTTVGVGQSAAQSVIDYRHKDGFNQLGDMGYYGEIQYNRMNYSDYTGYQTVNTDIALRDPDSWQPNVYPDAKLRPVAQKFLTPQLGNLRYWAIDGRYATVPPMTDRHTHNPKRYKDKVKEIINAQRYLSDKQKMIAEWYDNKLASLNLLGTSIIKQYGLDSVKNHTKFHHVVNGVLIEAMAPVWRLKAIHNAIRPFSAIHYLESGNKIYGWGGPGQGIVQMDGREWKSYLPTDAFPDYPSGTSCVCSAWTEAAKLLIGTTNINYTITFPAGSSVIEPGVTPAQPVVLHYDTLDQVAEDCMMSRVWGGVHFMPAVVESRKLCAPYGRQFYQKVTDYRNGL